jgi:hypothetical protein
MTRPAAVPPPQVPFLRQDGTVHPAWRRLLEALVERTGGYDGTGVLAGAGISVTPGDLPTIAVADTGVAAGTYAPPTSITVNSRGQITAIA